MAGAAAWSLEASCPPAYSPAPPAGPCGPLALCSLASWGSLMDPGQGLSFSLPFSPALPTCALHPFVPWCVECTCLLQITRNTSDSKGEKEGRLGGSVG